MDPLRAPRQPVDSRGVRFEQGVVTVVILGGFVFRVPWVLPVLTAVLATAAVAGPRLNPFLRLFEGLLAPRLGAPWHFDDPDEARLADLIGVGRLTFATVAILVGLGGLAWIIALLQAVASALRATAGIHVGSAIYERLRRRG